MNARVLRNLALLTCMLGSLGVAERVWAQGSQSCQQACQTQTNNCIAACHGCNSTNYQCCNSCSAQGTACAQACPH